MAFNLIGFVVIVVMVIIGIYFLRWAMREAARINMKKGKKK